MKIVVADDEPDMRDYFVKILPHLGHEVLAVTGDGKSLVEACRKSLPDLIITDIMMPEMNGDAALREIWLENPVPAILISAYQCPDWVHSADQVPIVRYLNKPINRAKLQSTLISMGESEPGSSAESNPPQTP